MLYSSEEGGGGKRWPRRFECFVLNFRLGITEGRFLGVRGFDRVE